jgi:hypothetical protein
MTRGVAIVLVLALGMAIAIVGTWAAARPSSAAARLSRHLRRVPSDQNVALLGALTAFLGIFVTVVSVIAEIWWLQGVGVP